MLVLSRKTGERIHIGDNITIEVRRVAGSRVTLALEAPRDLRILRGELAQAAREFQGTADHNHGDESKAYVITHERVTLPEGLAAPEMSRDYVI
jgi:carbon storage regulator CsrA